EEALDQFRLARQLDPDSLIIRADLGNAYRNARRYDEAIAELRAIIAKDPAFAIARGILGQTLTEKACAHKELLPEAVAELQDTCRLAGRHGISLCYLGAAHALSGDTDRARAILAELQTRSPATQASPADLAVVHVALGEKEEAIKQLERAFAERDGRLIYLKI